MIQLRRIGVVACVLAVVQLTACTTFVSNEVVENPKGRSFRTLHVSYINELPRGILTFDSGGVRNGKAPDRVEAVGKRDVPAIVALSKEGVGKYLVPLLKDMGVDATASNSSEDVPMLQIRPVSYAVECGSGNFICQASVSFQVSLTSVGANEAPLWSARFKVGAPMGGEQDTTVAQAFYTALADKLGSNKLLKSK